MPSLRCLSLGAALLVSSTALSLAQAPAPSPVPPAAPGGAPVAPPVTPAPPVVPAPADPARAAGAVSTDHAARLAALRGATLTLSQAIEAAEREGVTGGAQGRAISAEFERAEGNTPAHYEIKVVHADGRLVEHEVDAANGRILKSENQPFERYFTRLKPADLSAAPTSLRRAIELAEAQAGAGSRAVDAEVEREGATVAYEIEVAAPDRMREFKVSADGQVRND